MFMTSRYIDPTTDFGFKRLFGQEESKEILKQFLFDILDLPHPITELSYIPTEQVPTVAGDRLSIYDVYCTDSEGQRFIVEMQRNRQAYYKERALYYVTFPIVQQVQKGEDKPPFQLLPIYCVSVLNFRIDTMRPSSFLRRIQLADTETGEVFYRGLTFVFIELPKFTRTLDEVTTAVDRWLYLLRHMPTLEEVPEKLARPPFLEAFRIAEQANLSFDEWMMYEGSLKRIRDERGWYYTGLEEGREEGIQRGIQRGIQQGIQQGVQQGIQQGVQQGSEKKAREIARNLLKQGLDHSTIAEITGLSPADLENLA